MNTNVGTRDIMTQGDIMGIDSKVWYDPYSLVNIFSFGELQKQYCITYDSDLEDTFNVHIDNNSVIKFNKNKEGYTVIKCLKNTLILLKINQVQTKHN